MPRLGKKRIEQAEISSESDTHYRPSIMWIDGQGVSSSRFENRRPPDGCPWIIWRLSDLQPGNEHVALLVPGVYTELSLLVQIPLSC